MNRTTSRKELVGKVVSIKNKKTITVAVDSYLKHPVYEKRYLSTKKFAAHDENEKAQLGNTVLIAETRPYSKTKKFRLVKIIDGNKEGK